MSPVELLARMGAATPASPSGEAADAAAFEAAMAAQDDVSGQADAPVGGLGSGAEIAAQASAQANAQKAGGTSIVLPRGVLGSLAARFLARHGQTTQPPIICPPGETSVTKADQPIVCHDTSATAKPEQPLVQPGADATDKSVVLPGVAPTPTVETEAPQVLGGTAAAQTDLAEGAAITAQQTVGTAPEIVPLTLPDEAMVKPEPAAPDLPAVTVQADAATAAKTDAGAAAPLTAEAAPAVEAKTADPAKVDGAADLSMLDDLGAAQGDLPEAPAAPVTAQTAAQVNARADAPLAQRLSFDAVTQISAQILRKLEGRSTRFEMELHPADLGRVDVRLDIDAEGRMAARLSFDNAAAAADLRGRVDDLRRQLEDAGFQLAQDAFSFTERDRSGEQGDDRYANRRSLIAQAAEAARTIDVSAQPAIRASLRGGLDVRI